MSTKRNLQLFCSQAVSYACLMFLRMHTLITCSSRARISSLHYLLLWCLYPYYPLPAAVMHVSNSTLPPAIVHAFQLALSATIMNVSQLCTICYDHGCIPTLGYLLRLWMDPNSGLPATIVDGSQLWADCYDCECTPTLGYLQAQAKRAAAAQDAPAAGLPVLPSGPPE